MAWVKVKEEGPTLFHSFIHPQEVLFASHGGSGPQEHPSIYPWNPSNPIHPSAKAFHLSTYPSIPFYLPNLSSNPYNIHPSHSSIHPIVPVHYTFPSTKTFHPSIHVLFIQSYPSISKTFHLSIHPFLLSLYQNLPSIHAISMQNYSSTQLFQFFPSTKTFPPSIYPSMHHISKPSIHRYLHASSIQSFQSFICSICFYLFIIFLLCSFIISFYYVHLSFVYFFYLLFLFINYFWNK